MNFGDRSGALAGVSLVVGTRNMRLMLYSGLLAAASSGQLSCEHTCPHHIYSCADGGAPLGDAIGNTTAARCLPGTQCRECGLRGQALINATHTSMLQDETSAVVGAITSHVRTATSHVRSAAQGRLDWLLGAEASPEDFANVTQPGSCATLSDGGGALCCSALDNSAGPYWGQACVPLPEAHAPIGSHVRCAPSGWVIARLRFLPVSCGDLVLGEQREIIGPEDSIIGQQMTALTALTPPADGSTEPPTDDLQQQQAERPSFEPRGCSGLPHGNDALCCAARDGDADDPWAERPSGPSYGQLCVPSRAGLTFSTGSTCEPADWVVATEPARAGSCARHRLAMCELPKGIGCNAQLERDGCCGYKDGRSGTVWEGASCVAAADADDPFVDTLGARFTCAPAPWVARYQPQAAREGACGDEGLRLCSVQSVPLQALLASVGGVALCCMLLGLCICCEKRAHGLTRVRLEERDLDAVLEVQGSTLKELIGVLGRRLSDGTNLDEESARLSTRVEPPRSARSTPRTTPRSTPFSERLARAVAATPRTWPGAVALEDEETDAEELLSDEHARLESWLPSADGSAPLGLKPLELEDSDRRAATLAAGRAAELPSAATPQWLRQASAILPSEGEEAAKAEDGDVAGRSGASAGVPGARQHVEEAWADDLPAHLPTQEQEDAAAAGGVYSLSESGPEDSPGDDEESQHRDA